MKSLDRIEKKIDITYEKVARSAEDITGIKKDLLFCWRSNGKKLEWYFKIKSSKIEQWKSEILCIPH